MRIALYSRTDFVFMATFADVDGEADAVQLSLALSIFNEP